MFPGYGQYMKAKYGNLLTIEVTKDEFIKMLVESGKTQKEAEFQAAISVGLGSSCMIGDKMVSIKD